MDVLPYSMNIKVTDPNQISVIANKIRTMPGIDAVKEGKEVFNRVIAIANLIRLISYVGVVILLITITFIISNAIRLTLYARRREIRIMQLVGATDEFIKVPLIVEGIVFGIIGSTFAWGLLRLASVYVSYEVNRIMPMLSSWSSGVDAGSLLFGLAVTGAMIGAAGSFVSIRKFLHVN